MNVIYCSECGKENESDNICCKYCSSTLKTNKIVTGKEINSFEELITQENFQLLQNTPITPTAYNTILEEIIRLGYENFNYDENGTVLDNIYLLTEQYTHVYAKHKGEGTLGFYSANNIYLDDRLPDAVKITTLIHELTHHLYAEIYEQILMYVLKVEKSLYLEAFVLFTLDYPLLKLFNEYIAHTVQNNFVKSGYKDYGSFIDIKNHMNVNPNDYTEYIAFSNEVIEDIMLIINYFVDDTVKTKIIQQYDIDNVEKFDDDINLVKVKKVSKQYKINMMKSFLCIYLKSCLKNKKVMDELKNYKEYFK